MSHVLVCHEKHGDFYYAAATDEELAASALRILTDRWKDGYWYYDPDAMDEESQKWRPEELIWNILGIDHDEFWNLPAADRATKINAHADGLKEQYGDDQEILALKSKHFNTAVRDYKHRREYRKWYAEAKKLVESQDASAVATFKSGRTVPLAWHLLDERGDHEYERIELEPLRTAEDD